MTRSKLVILGCTALAALSFVACGGFSEEQTVKIKVTGADDAEFDEITEELKGMTDGSSNMTYRINDTITLAPVTDLKAFADKIDFGTVTDVDEATRTVSVTIGEVAPPADDPTPVEPATDDGADAADSPATPDDPADNAN